VEKNVVKTTEYYFYYVIVNFLRPIWSIILNIFFVIKYTSLYIFSKKSREKYIENKKKFDDCKIILDFNKWYKEVYSYKPDGEIVIHGKHIIGFLDHDNTPLEFFMSFGDCDEQGSYIKKGLKKLRYKAWRIWMKGNSLQNNHFDCLIQLSDGLFCLFNYGNNIIEKSFDTCMEKFKSQHKMFKDCNVYFKCLI